MRANPLATKGPSERIVNNICRATRKHYSAEDKMDTFINSLFQPDQHALAWCGFIVTEMVTAQVLYRRRDFLSDFPGRGNQFRIQESDGFRIACRAIAG